MIKKMSSFLSNILSKGFDLDEDSSETINYGIELAIYTLISTIALLGIGLIIGQFSSAACIIIIFYINQTVGGGIHKNSHISCFIFMAEGLLFSLLIDRVNLPNVLWAVFGAASLLILYCYPLVLHKNKEYLSGKRDTIIWASRKVTIGELIGLLLTFYYIPNLIDEFSIALLLSALSRLYAHYKKNS